MGKLGHIRRPGTAAPRKRGVFHEEAMAVEGESAFLKGRAGKAAVGGHDPALRDICKICGHDLAGDLRFDRGVFNLDQGFDTARQIAPHPIGGRDEHAGLFVRQAIAVAKAHDA